LVLGVLAAILGIAAPVIGTNVAVGKVDSTDSTTYTEAVGVKILNQGKLLANPKDPYDTNVPIIGTRVTKADSAAMDSQEAKDNKATIFTTVSTNVRTDTNAELSKSEATFAFDPSDSKLINCCGANLGGDTNVDFQGVMPLKFPFGTPQADVEVFDTTLQKAIPFTFAGEVDQYGMALYRFTQSIPVTQVPGKPFLEVPGSIAKGLAASLAPELADQIPAEGNVGMYAFYTAESDYLVEPMSGQIVDGKSSSTTTLRLNGGTKDIVTVAQVDGGSKDVEKGAAEIKSSADLLAMVSMALPLLLGLGALLAIIGIVLIVLAGKKKKAASSAGASS